MTETAQNPQAQIQRFSAETGSQIPAYMAENAAGDFVEYDDHAAAVLEAMRGNYAVNITADLIKDQLEGVISGALAQSLGGALDCSRSWTAWGQGTMSADDFDEIADSPERLREISGAIIAALPNLDVMPLLILAAYERAAGVHDTAAEYRKSQLEGGADDFSQISRWQGAQRQSILSAVAIRQLPIPQAPAKPELVEALKAAVDGWASEGLHHEWTEEPPELAKARAVLVRILKGLEQ